MTYDLENLDRDHLEKFSGHCQAYYQRSLTNAEDSNSSDREFLACQIILDALEHQLINVHEEEISHEHKMFLSSDIAKQHSAQLKSCGLHVHCQPAESSSSGVGSSPMLSHQILAEYAKIRDQQRRLAHESQMEQRKVQLEKLIRKKVQDANHIGEDTIGEYVVTSQSYLNHVRGVVRIFASRYKGDIGTHSFLAGVRSLIEKQMNVDSKMIMWSFNGSTLSEVSFNSANPRLKKCGEGYMKEAVDLLTSFMICFRSMESTEEAKEKEYEPMYGFHVHPMISNNYLRYIVSELPSQKNLEARATGSLETMSDSECERRGNALGSMDDQSSLIPWSNFPCNIL